MERDELTVETPAAPPATSVHVEGMNNVTVVHARNVHVATPPAADATELRNLQHLADRVRGRWIDDGLSKSLSEFVRIRMHFDERPDFVSYRPPRIIKRPDQPAAILDPNTGIPQIFADRGRKLLIAGEPGSGKTTSLLELCRDLLLRWQEEKVALPVVLNLSTWTAQAPLVTWAVDEMLRLYSVSREFGQLFIEHGRIILLLDGLDEVPAGLRRECVRAINGYEHGLPGLAVTARLHEYSSLREQLNLNVAVCLCPFQPADVDKSLASVSPHLDGLRAAIAADPELGELSTNPLMLSVMTLAFFDRAAETVLAVHACGSRTAGIFEVYIERMFEWVDKQGSRGNNEPRKRNEHQPRLSNDKLLRRLGRLARLMQSQSLALLVVETIQPSWLAHRCPRWIYAAVTRSLTAVALLYAADAFGRGLPYSPLWLGPVIALPGILYAGSLLHRNTPVAIPSGILNTLYFMATALLAFMAGLAPSFFADGWAGVDEEVMYASACKALLIGLGALLANPGPRWTNGYSDIFPVELFGWSTRAALKGACLAALPSALAFCLWGLAHRWVYYEYFGGIILADLWSDGVRGALGGMLSGAVLLGPRGGVVEVSEKLRPNEGMIRSRRYALAVLFGCGAGLIGLAFALDYVGAWSRIAFDFDANATMALVITLTAAFHCGGQALLRHSVLRVLLAATNSLPLQFIRFLEEARRLIFLQPVGGAYRFIHRLLLEHFAARAAASQSTHPRVS